MNQFVHLLLWNRLICLYCTLGILTLQQELIFQPPALKPEDRLLKRFTAVRTTLSQPAMPIWATRFKGFPWSVIEAHSCWPTSSPNIINSRCLAWDWNPDSSGSGSTWQLEQICQERPAYPTTAAESKLQISEQKNINKVFFPFSADPKNNTRLLSGGRTQALAVRQSTKTASERTSK